MTLSELKAFRRYLHRHPELSGEEIKTKELLKKKLKELNYDKLVEVGGTGLALSFKGNKKGRNILLRTDMDALPIQEINDFEHRSRVAGVAHKCGHDGHMAIMMGVAQELSENKPERGEVCLIFQPAEENGKGARAVLEDDNFDFKADMVFALHNLPGFELNRIVCKEGAFTAAAKSIIIRLEGKTSHAAEPEKGINPGLAISEILQLSEELSEKNTDRKDFRLISMIYVRMGEKAYGISAGSGEVHLTLRTWDNTVMEKLEKELVKRAKAIADKYKLKSETEWLEIFFANSNDQEAFGIIKDSAGENQLSFEERKEAFKWGEDFGLFTEKFRGAMFGIGAGKDTPALHNPDYDFPDDSIETGIRMFMTIVKKAG